MFKRLFKVLLSLMRSIDEWQIHLKNMITVKYKGVKFETFPKIKGILTIHNSGSIKLGKNVVFNSSIDSNYVGLFKRCTIAVGLNAELEIGDNTGLSGVSIYCTNRVKIGNYVNIGGNVCIWDTDFHPLNHLDRRTHVVSKIGNSPVQISDDVFIGANSIILKGVSIGERSIIGAGSVVTKSIPKDEIWAGNPAKFIKKNESY